jgi:hypothetical protein
MEQIYQTILEGKETTPCPCTVGKKCKKEYCPCPKCKKSKKMMKETHEDEDVEDVEDESCDECEEDKE